ncbi:RpnC/YadD family protein [Paenibacillus cymbidii]|uniref:hypothetical protein n=1 Tax=Paenibacillus cymbidii TaxID=1639034 RepID=UPI00108062B7|nr:hypothetical protein [Paenibacillus cymbidii]
MQTMSTMPADSLQRFATWLSRVLVRNVPPEKRREIETILSSVNTKGVKAMMSNLERTLDEIVRKREQQGIERGFEQGIERGIERGIEDTKHQVARSLIGKGMDDPFITDVTGLSLETIRRLRDLPQ